MLLFLFTFVGIASNKTDELIISEIENKSGIEIPDYTNIDDVIFMYEKAKELDIPLSIAFRLIYSESRFIAEPHNGQGYMQVIPLTYNVYLDKLDINDLDNVQKNITIGMTYLKDMYDYWDSWKLAVASYNIGKTGVRKRGIPESKQHYVNFITKKYYNENKN